MDVKITYTYDAHNNLIQVVYNSKGKIIYRNTFKYDKNNNCIEQSNYDSEEKLVKKWTWRYDEDDNCIESLENSEEGLKRRLVFKYDGNNNCIERLEYNSKKELKNISVLEYDDNNNRIGEQNEDLEKKTFVKWVHKYDNNNNRIEELAFNSREVLVEKRTYTYNYDEHNNWTEKVIYINDNPQKAIVREITYYPYQKVEVKKADFFTGTKKYIIDKKNRTKMIVGAIIIIIIISFIVKKIINFKRKIKERKKLEREKQEREKLEKERQERERQERERQEREKLWEKISFAINEGKKIQIKYKNYNGIIRDRIVSNISYNHSFGAGYIEGYCHYREEYRTFKLDRIISIEVLD